MAAEREHYIFVNEYLFKLNAVQINTIPAIFAMSASLLLFVLAFILIVVFLILYARHRPSIDGVGVLEILWIAAHSRTIRERMLDVKEPSLDNLRRAGMFEICLGEIHALRTRGIETAGDTAENNSEAFLE